MPDSLFHAAYTDETVLVTGGAGAIGSNLTKKLLDYGARVVVIDDLSSGFQANLPVHPRLRFLKQDIVERPLVRHLFAAFRPAYVFHLAAHYANLRSIEEPARDLTVNTLALLTLLEAAHTWPVKRFLFASSSCVYHHQAALPLTEESPLAPTTPYAISKATAEAYCLFYHQYYGLDSVILRYFNSYGPGDRPGPYRGVVPNMLATALQGKPLIITGSGAETRDFTFVDDIVRGTLLAGCIPEARGQIFNLASGIETSITSLAQLITDLTGNTAEIDYRPRRNWDVVQRRGASIKKAQQILGYSVETGLKEGLALTYTWTLSQTAKEGTRYENIIYQ